MLNIYCIVAEFYVIYLQSQDVHNLRICGSVQILIREMYSVPILSTLSHVHVE